MNQRLDQYASFSVPIPYADCYYHDQYEMNITSLTVVDTLGHVWTIGTPRYHRFAEVPGNSSFETLNDGDPFDSSNLVPGQASASCGKTWSTERQSWYCRGSIGVAVAPYGDARVAASSYFGQDGAVYWPGGDAVFLPAGQSTITVAYDPWVCYFTPRGTTVLRLDYVDPASGHRGWRQWGLGGPYVSAPANLCSTEEGDSKEDPTEHALPFGLDGFVSAVSGALPTIFNYAGDPVDLLTGGQTAEVTDFSLGGLAPSLALTRKYRSDIADMLFHGKPGAHARSAPVRKRLGVGL